jgi:hypothetical protein
MKGRSLTELKVMSASTLKVERTSLTNLSSLPRLVVSKKSAPERRVAVVSEPATMIVEALTDIS